MQTRTYADLFALIQALCGVVFSSTETGRIKALINRRAQRAYRSSNYWTRFLKIGEERRLSGDSVAATTTVSGSSYYIATVGSTNYFDIGVPFSALFEGGITTTVLTVTSMSEGLISVGDFVIDAVGMDNVQITAFGTGTGGVGTYTVSPSQSTIAPGTSLATFTVGTYFTATGSGTGTGTVFPALGYVPYSETGKSSVDTFLRFFKQAPYIASSVQEFDFTVTADGATLVAGDLNPSTAFLTYKAQFTDTYGDGAGETSSVPAEWFQYLAHGTYADYLRAEGQQEKAALADQEAEALLTEELIRLDENHTSGFVSNRIRTNANMQLRW
jgi:hypothetical protein